MGDLWLNLKLSQQVNDLGLEHKHDRCQRRIVRLPTRTAEAFLCRRKEGTLNEEVRAFPIQVCGEETSKNVISSIVCVCVRACVRDCVLA